MVPIEPEITHKYKLLDLNDAIRCEWEGDNVPSHVANIPNINSAYRITLQRDDGYRTSVPVGMDTIAQVKVAMHSMPESTVPRKVSEVPNPWKPYMDGSIWEFTEEQFRQFPDYKPMMDTHTGNYIGMGRYIWYHNGKYYVRFYTLEEWNVNPENAVERLAGWVKQEKMSGFFDESKTIPSGTILVCGREVIVRNFADEWMAPGVLEPFDVVPKHRNGWRVVRWGYEYPEWLRSQHLPPPDPANGINAKDIPY